MISIKEYVRQEKEALREVASKIGGMKLTIIQVGDVEASNRYVRNKVRDCEEVGIAAEVVKLEAAGLTSKKLQRLVNLYENPVIVQLPLPSGVEVPVVNPRVDVDGFHPMSGFVPCTPGGVMDYLREVGKADGKGKFAVVIGRSEIVGKPMAKMLQENDWTVATVHSKTNEADAQWLLRRADLVVCAVGKAGFLDPADCPNAFIVDVGINFNESGKLVGDVLASEEAKERTTPVPGGVGLLTRLRLLKNVVKFYTGRGD